MKKLWIFMMAACVISTIAHAQISSNSGVASAASIEQNEIQPKYFLGDAIELDGHKAIIVRVDPEGQGGLALYLERFLTPEEIAERAKKDQEEVKEWRSLSKAEKKERTAQQKKADYARKAVMDSICMSVKLGRFGEENQKRILEFCANNNVDVEKKLGEFHWATTLGDKWFIPGDAEIETIYTFIIGGIGKGKKYTNEKSCAILQKLQSTPGYETVAIPGFNEVGVPNLGYKSSTWHFNTEENKNQYMTGVMPHYSSIWQFPQVGGDIKYEIRICDEPEKFMGIKTPLFSAHKGRLNVAVREF